VNNARRIPFVKASACGNDFLLIDAALAPPDLLGFTRQICDRHEGVGADGVEWMAPHFSVDVEIRLINADGSPAEISGNGTRCVAAYICAMEGKERVSILTGAGTKICSLTSRQDSEYEFETEMGKATAEPELTVSISSGEVRGIPVSMGNPHFVVFVSEFMRNWQGQAAEIQKQPQFPEGVNVE
jgi:diaminopimelate epimerase